MQPLSAVFGWFSSTKDASWEIASHGSNEMNKVNDIVYWDLGGVFANVHGVLWHLDGRLNHTCVMKCPSLLSNCPSEAEDSSLEAQFIQLYCLKPFISLTPGLYITRFEDFHDQIQLAMLPSSVTFSHEAMLNRAWNVFLGINTYIVLHFIIYRSSTVNSQLLS